MHAHQRRVSSHHTHTRARARTSHSHIEMSNCIINQVTAWHGAVAAAASAAWQRQHQPHRCCRRCLAEGGIRSRAARRVLHVEHVLETMYTTVIHEHTHTHTQRERETERERERQRCACAHAWILHPHYVAIMCAAHRARNRASACTHIHTQEVTTMHARARLGVCVRGCAHARECWLAYANG